MDVEKVAKEGRPKGQMVDAPLSIRKELDLWAQEAETALITEKGDVRSDELSAALQDLRCAAQKDGERASAVGLCGRIVLFEVEKAVAVASKESAKTAWKSRLQNLVRLMARQPTEDDTDEVTQGRYK